MTWRTKETKITPTFKIDPTSDLASKEKQKNKKKKKNRSNKICTNNFFLSIFLLLSLIFFFFFFSCKIGGKILFLIWQDIQFIKTFIFSEKTTKYHGNYRNKAISFRYKKYIMKSGDINTYKVNFCDTDTHFFNRSSN